MSGSIYPKRTIDPSDEPQCFNSASDLKTSTKTINEVVDSCATGKCYSGSLQCVNGVASDCKTLFTDLITQGWGEKNDKNSLIYKLNHIKDPNTLRGQLIYELCRRASCIPLDRGDRQDGWSWMKENIFGSAYTIIAYVVSVISVLILIAHMLKNILTGDTNNIPTVLMGGLNNKKNSTSIGLFMVIIVLFFIFASSIMIKYDIKTSISLIFVLLLVYIPIVPNNGINTGLSVVVKCILLFMFIVFIIYSDIGKKDTDFKIKNLNEAGWFIGITCLIMGILLIALKFITGNTMLLIIGGILIIGAVIIMVFTGTSFESNDVSDVQKDSFRWIIIIMGCLFFTTTFGGYFGNTGTMTLISIILANLLIITLDNTGYLDPVYDYSSFSTSLTILTAVIILYIFIFKGKKHFKDTGDMINASSIFSTTAINIGIQTFLSIVFPPIMLALLVLWRFINTFINKNVLLNKGTPWSFIFAGSDLATLFNNLITADIYTSINSSGLGNTTNSKFDLNKQVGAPNSNVFPN